MRINLSALPVPPKEWDQQYMIRLVRQLQIMINSQEAITPLEGVSDMTKSQGHNISALTLRDIPTSATGLPKGSVYRDASNFLKIVP